MLDLSHYWGEDLDVSATGDLRVADRKTTGEQRVYRRLLTNPARNDRSGEPISSADYTFNPGYGAGVGEFVGQPTRTAETQSLIRTQMAKESAVARTPAPVIEVASDSNTLSAVIRYTDAASTEPVTVSFELNT